MLDEIVAPLSYRAFDGVAAMRNNEDLSEHSTTGLRQMLGTNPDAIEAWTFDTITFEHLLERLAPYGRVVLLSGDVHYSSATLMSYWRGATTQPARFAQFTSSGFRNVMPARVTFADRSLGFVLLSAGRTQLDLVPVMRSRLQSVPVFIPSWGWPDDNEPFEHVPEKASRLNPALPPDWRWRVIPLLDERSEDERSATVRLLPIDNDAINRNLADPSTVIDAYQAIAARHQHALDRLRNARQFLFRANVGHVRFEPQPGGKLNAIHEVFTAFSDPDQPAALDPKPEAFLVQVAPLGPEDEEPPTRLRQKALEVELSQVQDG